MTGALNDLSRAWTDYFLSWSASNIIFLTLILIVIYLFKNRDARTLYYICVIGLVKILIPPFFNIIGPVEIVSVKDLFAGLLINTPKEIVSDGLSFYMPVLSKKSIFMLIWLSFFCIMMLYALYKIIYLRKILRGAIPADISRLKMNRELGKIKILESRFDHSPFVIGIIKPRIILPSCWKNWSKECSCSVVAHEIVHIRNGDRWINLIRYFAETVQFFNPLVWIIGKKLDQYREMACDDSAVKMTRQTSEAYSRHLLDISRHLSQQNTNTLANTLIKKHGELVNRINYQLSNRTSNRTNRFFCLATMMLLTILIFPFSFDYCGVSAIDVRISRKGIKIENRGFRKTYPVYTIKSLISKSKTPVKTLPNKISNQHEIPGEKTDNAHIFNLISEEKAGFCVYNILGQRIREYPEKKYPEGKIYYEFDGLNDEGKEVPKGIYIVRMKAEKTKTQAAKIILN